MFGSRSAKSALGLGAFAQHLRQGVFSHEAEVMLMSRMERTAPALLSFWIGAGAPLFAGSQEGMPADIKEKYQAVYKDHKRT